MAFTDKRNVIAEIHRLDKVKLELGCGERKRIQDSIGIDALDYPCVDIVGDVLEVLKHIPDASVQAIHAFHFMEHVEDLETLLSEIERIMLEDGTLEIVVPHFSNPYFYSDYTHRKHFGLYTLSYFARNSFFKRRVPSYQKKQCLELRAVTLNFKSSPPFYFRHLVKRLITMVVNMTNSTKEFYEENLCYIFPCYEIRYCLTKKQAAE